MANTQLKNPCLDCDQGRKDKNNPACLACNKRIEYVKKIEDDHHIVLSRRPLMTPEKEELKTKPRSFEKEKTKICSNITCAAKGKPQPLSNFGKRTASKDGYTSYCKDCKRKYGTKYRAEKAGEIKGVDKPGGELVENGAEKMILSLDFTEYPDIYKSLIKVSHEELRRPEMQALYLLRRTYM